MTALLEQLQSDVKDAMRARESERVQNLRLFVNALQQETKSKQRDLEPAEEIAILQRERKRRIEAAEGFDSGGASDRAARERDQAAMLDVYLPAAMSEDELSKLVADAVSESGATGPSEMGAEVGS